MSSKIRVLDELTINKIAAGEVIENPSSVVKELIENAIDAGATEITLEIKSGGRQLIRISDNGCGMNRDDALLCLERHATSKIQSIEDIHAIHTMGFRGEAVPSIASISKMTLLTCAKEESEGTLVMVDGGLITHCGGAVRSPGTTFEIKSLFFNVPVRKKFQRSPAYDVSEILRIVTIQALAHPDIAFQLISNEKNLLSTQASKLRERIVAVLGQEYANGLCPIESSSKDYHLSGYIGLPHYSRHNRTGQYLFINQRAVVSSSISFAMKDAYGTMLDAGRHPIFVLNLTMDGDLVDVNVHPQKREVRLRQESALREWLRKSVEEALRKQEKPLFRPIAQTYSLPAPSFSPTFTPRPSFSFTPASPPAERRPDPSFFTFEPPQEKTAASRVIETLPGYVLLSSEQGLLELMDQRAAHGRILYEKMEANTGSNAHPGVQQLLIPHDLKFSAQEIDTLRSNSEILKMFGFEIEGTSVRAVPQAVDECAIDDVLRAILQEIEQSHAGHFLQQELQKKLCLAISRAAVPKRSKMSLAEAQSLYKQLMQCKTPHTCPNGKPTLIELSVQDLAKYFQIQD